MTNLLPKDNKVLFTLLSVMNWYDRVVVGDSSGKIFTLGYRTWQKIVNEKAFTTAASGGPIRFLLPSEVNSTVRVNWNLRRFRPLRIILCHEPLFGLEVYCSWDSIGRLWYLWPTSPLLVQNNTTSTN
jgi:hypothetical protein